MTAPCKPPRTCAQKTLPGGDAPWVHFFLEGQRACVCGAVCTPPPAPRQGKHRRKHFGDRQA